MAPCTHPGTSREVHEARQGTTRTCSRPCAFGEKKTNTKNTKGHQTLKKHTTEYIHSSPATATTSRRRATKHVPRVSLYSHASFIHPGFVEIGLAGIHTYAYTRTSDAAPPVYDLVLYFLASAASSFSAVMLVCISGFGVARWCLILSFP